MSKAPRQTKKNKQQASDYHKLSQEDHPRVRPGMYIGSTHPEIRKVRGFKSHTADVALSVPVSISAADGVPEPSYVEGHFTKETTIMPYAVEKVIIEVMNNAGDGILKAYGMGRTGRILITRDGNRITMRNTGACIPAEMHKEGCYAPELVFGSMLTSSTFEDKKSLAGGTNGVGAKLANIFSILFEVKIGDPDNGKLYDQRWENGMTKCHPPTLEDGYSGEAFVEVSYVIDFAYFNKRAKIDNENAAEVVDVTAYPVEIDRIIASHAVNHSRACQCPVFYNGHNMTCKDILQYYDFSMNPEVTHSDPDTPLNPSTAILFYQWPTVERKIGKKMKVISFRPKKHPNKTQTAEIKVKKETHRILPRMELAVFDTPDNGRCISLVNGIETTEGGTHVKAMYDAIIKVLTPHMQHLLGDNSDLKLKPKHLMGKLTIVMNYRLANAEFKSQTKGELTKPSTSALNLVFPANDGKMMAEWEGFDRIKRSLKGELWANASPKVAKSKIHLGIPKLTDALDASKPGLGHTCTLVLVEGDSAKQAALTAYGNRKKYGVFPLRGKGINAIRQSEARLLANEEVKRIIEIVQFKAGVDYRIDENYQKLRYGRIIFLMDSDGDGGHIRTLEYARIAVLAPTFIQRPGTILDHRTVTIKVTKGTSKKAPIKRFYSSFQYEDWLKVTPDHSKWTTKYYKGLGTLTDDDVLYEGENPFVVKVLYNEATMPMLELLFGNHTKRKAWFKNHNENPAYFLKTTVNGDEFLENEMYRYSKINISRSLAGIDGLKEAQRKVYHTVMQCYGYSASNGVKDSTEFKVSDFAGRSSSETGYHYGPSSLEVLITNGGADYIGTNNYPFIKGNGNFGSRIENGADAASSRYILIEMYAWLRLLLRKEDVGILDMVHEEEMEKEPHRFFPLIPADFINGNSGIGSAYRYEVQPMIVYEVIDYVISVLKELLKSKGKLPKGSRIKPKLLSNVNYARYTGEVEILRGDAVREVDDVLEATEAEMGGVRVIPVADESEVEIVAELVEERKPKPSKSKKPVVLMKGVFQKEGKHVRVTEIPIWISIDKYDAKLKKWVADKIISSFQNDSGEYKIDFLIKGMKEPTLKKLHLIRKKQVSELNYLSDSGKVCTYASPESRIDTFVKWRLPKYKKRKQLQIKNLEQDIEKEHIKLKMILLIFPASGKSSINLNVLSQKEIIAKLTEHGIPEENIVNAKLLSLSADSVTKIKEKIANLERTKKEVAEKLDEHTYIEELEELRKGLVLWEKAHTIDVNERIAKHERLSKLAGPPK